MISTSWVVGFLLSEFYVLVPMTFVFGASIEMLRSMRSISMFCMTGLDCKFCACAVACACLGLNVQHCCGNIACRSKSQFHAVSDKIWQLRSVKSSPCWPHRVGGIHNASDRSPLTDSITVMICIPVGRYL